jgi:hypothetical protein
MKKQLTKEEKSKTEYAVFDRPVQTQGGDIYKVLSMGTCVEFTDKIGSAEAAYREASKPRQMFKIYRAGGVEKMREEML